SESNVKLVFGTGATDVPQLFIYHSQLHMDCRKADWDACAHFLKQVSRGGVVALIDVKLPNLVPSHWAGPDFNRTQQSLLRQRGFLFAFVEKSQIEQHRAQLVCINLSAPEPDGVGCLHAALEIIDGLVEPAGAGVDVA